MALITCRECKSEVSNAATACPKCGAPVKKPGMKIGGCVGAGCLVIVVVFGIAAIGMNRVVSDSSSAPDLTPPPVHVETARDVIRQIGVEWSWKKEGFGSIMVADFTVTNKSKHTVKDLVIEITSAGPSGTEIDSNTRTVFEVFKPGETRTVKAFNMGFINSQAVTAGLRIKDLTLVE